MVSGERSGAGEVSGRRTVHAKDGNHWPLMSLAKHLFPIAESHANGSHGYDAILGNARNVYAVEFKKPHGPKSKKTDEDDLSDNEKAARARWGRRYRVIRTEDELIALARE